MDVLSTGTVLDRLVDESAGQSDDSSSEADSMLVDETLEKPSSHLPEVDELRTLYQAALIIKNTIRQPATVMDCPWPPTADNLTLSSAKVIIPIELYNLLARIVGVSDDLIATNYVKVDNTAEVKLTSICQDIIYLASKGRTQTLKSLALCMTVRHLTGLSQLLSIINKLGHSASVDTIIGLETSLAELRLVNEHDSVPHGFSKSMLTILVWDNIDFGEETLSE